MCEFGGVDCSCIFHVSQRNLHVIVTSNNDKKKELEKLTLYEI